MKYSELKEYQRSNRDTFPDALGLRSHRALSWLQKAEASQGDEDAQYIFLWIAFNAAYANDLASFQRPSESHALQDFLRKICELDTDNRIANLIWQEYSDKYRILLDNKFVFQPFWDYHNGLCTESEWQQRFSKHRSAANQALAQQDTAKFLGILFVPLYTLRNQLVHGGATCAGAVNREQLKLGCQILSQLVPLIIEMMMRNPGTLWGDAYYPVV
jgi:hypothetical protein